MASRVQPLSSLTSPACRQYGAVEVPMGRMSWPGIRRMHAADARLASVHVRRPPRASVMIDHGHSSFHRLLSPILARENRDVQIGSHCTK